MASAGNGLPDGYVYDGTGTGTELDPYVPLTCNQFMYAILQSNSYVKMTTILDFSVDPQYKNGINVPISLLCIKLYTDMTTSQSICGISGLYVSAANFIGYRILANNVEQNVNNVCFVNCIWQKYSTDNTALYYQWLPSTNVSDCFLIFNNCQFSLLIKQNNKTPYIERGSSIPSNSIIFNYCSQYFIFSGDCVYATQNASYVESNSLIGYTRNYCTVEIQGCKYYPPYQNMQGGYSIIGPYDSSAYNIKHCTIYGTIDIFGKSSYSSVSIYNCENCCIALNMTEMNNYNSTSIAVSSMTGVSVIDTTIIHDPIQKGTDTGNIKYLTTSQMKNQTYLTSIGFLP